MQFPDLAPDQGIGWFRRQLDGETVWGHDGGEDGAAIDVMWWPERDLGLVVLVNAEADDATMQTVTRAMRDAAAGW